MNLAPVSDNEMSRLAELHTYGVLDTPSEEAFDELAQLAADICEVPIALITLVDDKRQWFKARVGLTLQETPRDVAFCAHAIRQPGLFVVADAATDIRFSNNPLVTSEPYIRFYAGAPLINPAGHALGTLCVIDRKPRKLSAAQERALLVLSRHVMTQLALKRQALELAQADGPRLTLLSVLEDQMQSQVKERRSTQRLVSTLENMRDAFIALDHEWRFTHINSRAAKVLRVDAKLLIGKNIFEELPKSFYQPFYQAAQQSMISQKPAELEAHFPALQIWIFCRMLPAPDGLAVFFSDVTKRRQSEAAIREKEEQLRIAVAASAVGFWDRDLTTNNVFFSPQWKQHLGYADDELPNRYAEWESRLHPDERSDVLTRTAGFLASQQTLATDEFRLRHRDGSYRWIYMRAECLRDEAGKPLRMTGCHIDITERKQIEVGLRAASDRLRELTRQLIESEENQRRVLNRELHDWVGQNLSAVNLSLDLIKARLAQDGIETVSNHIEDARKLVAEAVRHTRDMMASLRPPALEDFGLLAALRLHAGAVSARSGVRIDVQGDDPYPRLPLVVETTLFRIAQEGLVNALKHAHATRISIELITSSTHFELVTADDGAGFDVTAVPFGPNWGMQTMHERAAAIGATLRVVSAVGSGTRVTVQGGRGA